MRDTDQLRSNVLTLCRGFLLGFAVLALWLVYWQVIQAPSLRADPHNPRAKERIKLTRPGRVLAEDGTPMLEGARSNGEWYLEYPGPHDYCHLTGYNDRTGLQVRLRDPLYALGRYEDPWARILRGRTQGCDVRLTINAKAQKLATRLMAGRSGAVVAIDPRDGAVRVMVSAPAYDPTRVLTSSADYAEFTKNADKPELNRALLGQYAPGSVLKVLTAAAAIEEKVADPDDEFDCDGTLDMPGATIHCRRTMGHGTIDMTEALVDSCNVVFARLGRKLGPERFLDYVEGFHLLTPPRLPLLARGGRIADMTGPNAKVEVAEAAFGQGATLVSPATMARLAATIAAGGEVPALRLIESIVAADGMEYPMEKPAPLGRAVSAATAATVGGMMVEVVERGTGSNARIPGISVAGKTGSAQNPAGLAHAWFIAYAPAENPVVAVAVIVEHGGAGGRVAAPIARKVIQAIL